jgi:integrase
MARRSLVWLRPRRTPYPQESEWRDHGSVADSKSSRASEREDPGQLCGHGASALKPSLGRKVLRKLTVSDVDQLLAWKRNAGYSANTVRIIRAVLRCALRQAEREGLVSRNAAGLSTAPRVRSDEGRALSVDQARALLERVKGTREEPLLTVMLAFGLRRGETLGLHWSALDWDAATLKVTHAVKRVRDRAETTS